MKYLKWIAILLALTLGWAAFGTMLFVIQDASPADDVTIMESQAIGTGPKVPYYAYLDIEDLEADTWYVLVDLSDKTNFPHVRTGSVTLKQLHYTGVLSAATQWDIRFGVMGEIGDASSYVEWFHTSHRVRNTQFDEKWALPEHGLNLSLKSDDTLQFVASREFTNTAVVTTATQLTSPVTESGVVTTTAGNGDIVMYVEEIDAGGHIDLSVGAAYNTQ